MEEYFDRINFINMFKNLSFVLKNLIYFHSWM